MSCIPCLVISAVLLCLAPQMAQAKTAAPAHRKIIAAVQSDFPPTYSINPENETPQGFAIDLLNEVARRAGLEVEYVVGRTWEESQEMVLSGKADIIPSLVIDETRKRRFAFTNAVERLPLSYIVRNESRITGLKSGMRAGIMRGSIAQVYLQNNKDISIVPSDSLQKLLIDLLAGHLDIIMVPAPSIVKLAMDSGIDDHLRILEPPLIEGIRAMAMRPGDTELLGRLNAVIDQFVGTPEYRKIYFKWWGKPKSFWTTRKVTWAVTMALAVGVLGMGCWRYLTLIRLNRSLGQTLEHLEESQRNLLQSEDISRHLSLTVDRERAQKQQQLEQINSSLEQRINQAVAELRQKDVMLIQQNRLAAMGEMVNNIAHQWRQPLNNIGLIVQNLPFSLRSGKLNSLSLEKEVTAAMEIIMYMSHTIDDFRNFFREDKEKQDFSVNTVVNRTLKLVATAFSHDHIQVNVTNKIDITANGYQNEYAQVLLNILSNAREVLVERGVPKPRISINMTSKNGRSVVTVSDNGGGIADDILPKIFDPYFTTKDTGKGTGIGLYMSKVIMEQHMGGRITAHNIDGGAEFAIEL